jgi:hypothetical protein
MLKLIITLILLPCILPAQENKTLPPPLPSDFIEGLTESALPDYSNFSSGDVKLVIGMNLDEAYNWFGNPAAVFPFREEKAEHDNVVFYFNHNIYLFWYKNRVWQLRFDKRYTGTVLGLKIGDNEKKAASILGQPIAEDGTHIYSVKFKNLDDYPPFPVRARLIFEHGKISDIYIYRGNF